MYMFLAALEKAELMSHRADFFGFYMRINQIRHICGLGPMHLYGRKTFDLLKAPCLPVYSSVLS